MNKIVLRLKLENPTHTRWNASSCGRFYFYNFVILWIGWIAKTKTIAKLDCIQMQILFLNSRRNISMIANEISTF